MGNIKNNKNGGQITGRTGLDGSGNYLPLDLGSPGHVLTIDGSSNVIWATASSSSTSGIWGIPDSTGTYTYYSTLTLAIAAAVSGQTIELFSDVTETSDVTIGLKNGVNINLNGHTYKRTVAFATNSLFRDNGVAVGCSIKNGTLWNTSGGGSSFGLILTAASIVDLSGTRIYVSGSGNTAIYLSNSSAEVYNAIVEVVPSVVCLYISSGKAYNIKAKGPHRICELVTSTSFVYNSDFTSSGGNISLYIGAGSAINCTSTNTGANSAVWLVGGTAIDCVAYSAGIGFLINSLSSSAINCIGYSSGNLGIQVGSTGANLIQGCKAYSAGSYGLNILGPVTISISNSTFYSSVAVAANSNPSTGTVRFENCTFDSLISQGVNIQASTDLYNCVVNSYYNNINGHAVVFAGASNCIVTGCVFRVTNSSAYALHSSSAITEKYTSNTYIGSTTPVNPNITQGVSNTPDSQGNILI